MDVSLQTIDHFTKYGNTGKCLTRYRENMIIFYNIPLSCQQELFAPHVRHVQNSPHCNSRQVTHSARNSLAALKISPTTQQVTAPLKKQPLRSKFTPLNKRTTATLIMNELVGLVYLVLRDNKEGAIHRAL